MEENTRLTDLTRMLLSSQAFSGFLNELSGTGLSSSTNSLQQLQPQSQQPQPIKKDINPHQVARQLQEQQQIGMASIPEISLDFPLVDRNVSASSWNAGVGLNNFSVYSLTSIPEGPALDIEKLSGKGDEDHSFQAPDAIKHDMPHIEYAKSCMDVAKFATTPSLNNGNPDVELDETTFSLYAKPRSTPSKSSSDPAYAVVYTVDPKEVKAPFGHLLDTSRSEAAAMARLKLMCSRIDTVSARIAAVTSHLS